MESLKTSKIQKPDDKTEEIKANSYFKIDVRMLDTKSGLQALISHGLIDNSSKESQLKKMFNSGSIKSKIKWIGSAGSFKYFIKGIADAASIKSNHYVMALNYFNFKHNIRNNKVSSKDKLKVDKVLNSLIHKNILPQKNRPLK